VEGKIVGRKKKNIATHTSPSQMSPVKGKGRERGKGRRVRDQSRRGRRGEKAASEPARELATKKRDEKNRQKKGKTHLINQLEKEKRPIGREPLGGPQGDQGQTAVEMGGPGEWSQMKVRRKKKKNQEKKTAKRKKVFPGLGDRKKDFFRKKNRGEYNGVKKKSVGGRKQGIREKAVKRAWKETSNSGKPTVLKNFFPPVCGKRGKRERESGWNGGGGQGSLTQRGIQEGYGRTVVRGGSATIDLNQVPIQSLYTRPYEKKRSQSEKKSRKWLSMGARPKRIGEGHSKSRLGIRKLKFG